MEKSKKPSFPDFKKAFENDENIVIKPEAPQQPVETPSNDKRDETKMPTVTQECNLDKNPFFFS
jgi:hypothetical protein